MRVEEPAILSVIEALAVLGPSDFWPALPDLVATAGEPAAADSARLAASLAKALQSTRGYWPQLPALDPLACRAVHRARQARGAPTPGYVKCANLKEHKFCFTCSSLQVAGVPGAGEAGGCVIRCFTY